MCIVRITRGTEEAVRTHISLSLSLHEAAVYTCNNNERDRREEGEEANDDDGSGGRDEGGQGRGRLVWL